MSLDTIGVGSTVEDISIQEIYPDLGQPRVHFDLEGISQLAGSVREAGLIKPILVEGIPLDNDTDDGLLQMLCEFDDGVGSEFQDLTGLERNLEALDMAYLIVTGHRRYEAHWRGNIPRARCQVVSGRLTPSQRLALQVAEDSQEAIPEWEVADNIYQIYHESNEVLSELLDDPKARVPIVELAARLGKSEGSINRALNFRNLTEVGNSYIAKSVRNGKTAYSIAAEIGRLSSKDQQRAIYRSLDSDTTLKEIRERVDRVLSFEEPFLSDDAFNAAQKMYDGSNLREVQEHYGELALAQIRRILGLEDETETADDVLSEHAIEKIELQIGGSRRALKRDYFERVEREVRFDVGDQIEGLTYETDLFGNCVVPEEDNFYNGERAAYYGLFKRVERSLASYIEACNFDPEVHRLALDRRPDLDRMVLRLGEKIRSIYSNGNGSNGNSSNGNGSHPRRRTYRGSFKQILEEGGRLLSDYKLGGEIIEIPLNDLVEDSENVRRTFNDISLERLADSISSVGQIETLLVEEITSGDDEGKYRIVTGHRRYRACRIAGKENARCIVAKDLTAKDRKMIQIVEDSQKSFSAKEGPSSWFNLYKLKNLERKERGEDGVLSISEFSRDIGVAPTRVRKAFAYLSLDDSIRRLVDNGVLNYSTAVEIAYLPGKYSGKKTSYEFDPEEDFYVPPERIFGGEDSKYLETQRQIALRAIFSKMSSGQVRHLIDERNPNAGQSTIDFGDDWDVVDQERITIVGAFLESLETFERRYDLLKRQSDTTIKRRGGYDSVRGKDYVRNVLHSSNMRSRIRRLEGCYESLKEIHPQNN